MKKVTLFAAVLGAMLSLNAMAQQTQPTNPSSPPVTNPTNSSPTTNPTTPTTPQSDPTYNSQNPQTTPTNPNSQTQTEPMRRDNPRMDRRMGNRNRGEMSDTTSQGGRMQNQGSRMGQDTMRTTNKKGTSRTRTYPNSQDNSSGNTNSGTATGTGSGTKPPR